MSLSDTFEFVRDPAPPLNSRSAPPGDRLSPQPSLSLRPSAKAPASDPVVITRQVPPLAGGTPRDPSINPTTTLKGVNMPFWGDSGNQGDALRRAKGNTRNAEKAAADAKRQNASDRKKAERDLATMRQREAEAQRAFDRAKRR